jgi:hypothetical protein
MANTSGKHKPPSRVRYERTHPTVSVRVDESIYRQLTDLRQRSGISMVEILLVGLEKLAPMAGSAFHEGQMLGLSDAYEVSCPTCQYDIIDLAPDPSSEPDPPID